MDRPIRRTLIRVLEEETYGSGLGANLVATDAIEVIDPEHEILRTMVPRRIFHPHMGASEELVAARVARIRFKIEITGSGIAGTPPPWARLLRGCGFAQAAAASTITWSPVSAAIPSLFFQYSRAGAAYTSKGCRGKVKFMLPAFGIPMMEFEFTGFETSAFQTGGTGLPAYDLTAYRRPVVLTDANAGDIRLGGTFASGQVTGGTVLASRGLEIDTGVEVEHKEYLGAERVDIVNREVTGKMSVALTPAQEVAWRNEINANTLTTLGFNWGTAAGERFTLYAPQVQRVNPQGENYKGDLLIATDLRCLPTRTGNDDIILVQR